MIRKLGFGLLWLGFAIYAFGFAPPNQPDTLDLIVRLSSGQWDGINPLLIAEFNIMGIWPMIYGAVLYADGHGQKLPAWPFAALSFGVGAFALLPYLALRQPNPTFAGEKSRLLQFWDSRLLGVGLSLGAIACLAYGISQGDWSAFFAQWRSDRFVHVMTLDFCLLSLLFPALLGDDLRRRGLSLASGIGAIALVPLLGPLVYLCLRPSLPGTPRPSETVSPAS